MQVKSKQQMKRNKQGFEEHVVKDAQTSSNKVFIYIKRKQVVTKLVRLLNDKSKIGGQGSRMPKHAQRSSKSCPPETAFGSAGDS